MSGGFNGYDYSTQQPPRLELIKQVLAEQQADFVSLIDTFRWDEIYTPQQLCELFGYKQALSVNLNDARLKKLGHNNGITVLSNIENTVFETINLGTRNGILSSVQTPTGLLNVFSLYLDDLAEDSRLKQLEELKRYLTNTPTLVSGDLNTLSPKDLLENKTRIDSFLKQNPKYFSLTSLLEDMARTEVISGLTNLGFSDTDSNYYPTFPTKLTSLSEVPLIRIDFFLSKDIEVKRCETLYGDLYDKASDHYPLLLEI